ncbi:lead, cadmium, zinc and mercury transporting ATPase, copper-translocating P-type ATPase [Pelagibacterium halotolerans B2]|uniref:Lead, cadmium, zinc and mercury transporting ATPase, copper-translocating P-type ATPase n=2 Tax=Pelagibacterium TaxID=1082930 RepID=G4RDU0_PELHB|nr:lead, cadmium, zinc and mercury transporting ATPase, copper-translocating P-type ATPase [Pelagibacterium halotolerans B2]
MSEEVWEMNERHHHHQHGEDSQGATDASGHDKHAGHSVSMFRDKFWLSLALTIPTVIWEPMIQDWFGYTAPPFPGSAFIPAFFGTVVFTYGGRVFLNSAIGELKAQLPGMMTLISLAISVAFVYSFAVLLGFDGHPLWWELATLVTIMLLGHWIEMRSISQAQGALNELAKLLPDLAVRVIEGDRTEEVPVSGLRTDDVVLVRPGASIPADGVVISGKSAVNESMITGESQLVDKTEGSEVLGGTVNGQGSLRVRVLQTGQETALAGIMRLVSQAQSSRSRAQALADRAAFLLTVVAIVAGVATLAAWLLLGAEIDFTVTRVVTVLVIACPHALGLAVPLVTAISTTLGARNGLLIRDRRGLEEARNLDTVVFDKTGTLTLGSHRVVEIVAAKENDPDTVLSLAAAVERDSEHPIAQALLKSAEDKGLALPRSTSFESAAGKGVEAVVEARRLSVGGPALLRQRNVELDNYIANATRRFGDNGQAAIYLVEGENVLAVFAIADQVRPESKAAVAKLQSMAIEVVILTGDSEAVARSVGRELGIDTVFAGVLPDQKSDKIKELQARGKRVAMVGDGVNDAPALVTADVGVAVGAGTDVAVEAGDVVLVRSDPRDIARIVILSRATYRKMIQNLWWAAGYNIVAIPLAAGVLYWAGIVLAPAVGAVLMSASTVIVAINAQLLRRLDMAR